MKFPTVIGLPRRIVYTLKEYLDFVNINNGKKTNLFQNVYDCNVIEGKANYDNIEIHKLFFDFDLDNSWEEANKLHQYLKLENIKHKINFSGRGYHIYIFTIPYKANNIKSCILNSQKFFIDKLNLKCDTQVLGDNSRLCRIENTFNIKRKKFCIPLKEIEFEKGDVYCKKLADKQNFITDSIISKNLFEIKQFDYQPKIFDEFIDIKNDDIILENFNIESVPPCIKELLIKKDLGWKERYLLILFFKEIGHSQKEIAEILKKHLSANKYRHCIIEERQLQYLFKRDDLVFPGCEKIMSDGLCRKKCEKYNNIIYK